MATSLAHASRGRGRPPLTSVVVRKDTGLPSDGFLEAMVWVGYVSSTGEVDERSVWERALSETHEYWRPKLRDTLN